MMRKVSWILCVVILSVLSSSAFSETIDVVRLKNGDVIKGVIIETIPNKAIKIETTGGRIIVYTFDEIEKMTKENSRKPETEVKMVKLKNRTLATVLSAGTGLLACSGSGQLYNGQYVKAALCLGAGFLTASAYINAPDGQDSAAALLFLIQYGYSIYDANISAKKINKKRLKGYEQKNVSTSLNYIPHQGLMASYHFRF